MISRTDIEDMTDAQDEAREYRTDEGILLTTGCPWCGQKETLSFRSVGSLTADMPSRPYKVVCSGSDCEDVSGPVAYGKFAAAGVWNARADLARPSQAGDERVARLLAEICQRIDAALRAHDGDEEAFAALMQQKLANGDGKSVHFDLEELGGGETDLRSVLLECRDDMRAALAAMDTP